MTFIDKLLERKTGLISYMKMKIDEEDYHAVADAAMDIREIVAQLELLRGYNEDKSIYDEYRTEE